MSNTNFACEKHYVDVYHSVRCCESVWVKCRGRRDYKPRTIYLGRPNPTDQKFAANIIRNQKYSVITFIPLVDTLLLFRICTTQISLFFFYTLTNHLAPCYKYCH